MKVLVTGGAGFIGSNFVKMAIGGKFAEITEITVLDKLTYTGSMTNLGNVLDDARVEFHLGDICDFSLVDKLVSKIDVIINFAAESHVDKSIENSTEFIRTNVMGTQVLLEAAKKHGVRKFLQMKFMAQYLKVHGMKSRLYSLTRHMPLVRQPRIYLPAHIL